MTRGSVNLVFIVVLFVGVGNLPNAMCSTSVGLNDIAGSNYTLGPNYTLYHVPSFRTPYPGAYDNLTFALDQSQISDNCTGSLEKLLGCQSMSMKTAFYWMHLIAPLAHNINIRVYPSEHFKQWRHDFRVGEIDVVDKTIALTPALFDVLDIHITTPVQQIQYAMYIMQSEELTHFHGPSAEFLLAPFSVTSWICTIVAILFAYGLHQLIWSRNRVRRQLPVSYRWFAIVLFSCSLLSVMYKSSLKASLTVPRNTKEPFEDLYELARQIENGSRRLVLDDHYSIRWALVADDNEVIAGFSQFRTVYRAIQNVGPKKALVFEPNITKICQLMQTSSEYVFFGHRGLLRSSTYCSRLCFWTYTVSELPSLSLSWAVSKKPLLGELANIVVHGLEKYRDTEFRRLLPPAGCVRVSKPVFHSISNGHILMAFLWLCGGTVAATVVCSVERYYHMIYGGRKRIHVLPDPSSTGVSLHHIIELKSSN